MLLPLSASQEAAATLLVRQHETANMALRTAYRDPLAGERLSCPLCGGSAEFELVPDGTLLCGGCDEAVGRYAMRPDLVA